MYMVLYHISNLDLGLPYFYINYFSSIIIKAYCEIIRGISLWNLLKLNKIYSTKLINVMTRFGILIY